MPILLGLNKILFLSCRVPFLNYLVFFCLVLFHFQFFSLFPFCLVTYWPAGLSCTFSVLFFSNFLLNMSSFLLIYFFCFLCLYFHIIYVALFKSLPCRVKFLYRFLSYLVSFMSCFFFFLTCFFLISCFIFLVPTVYLYELFLSCSLFMFLSLFPLLFLIYSYLFLCLLSARLLIFFSRTSWTVKLRGGKRRVWPEYDGSIIPALGVITGPWPTLPPSIPAFLILWVLKGQCREKCIKKGIEKIYFKDTVSMGIQEEVDVEKYESNISEQRSD